MLTQEYVDNGGWGTRYPSGKPRTFDLWAIVPRDPHTSLRDVVKVTGWAIRCTILRNSPKQHLRRSLITLGTDAESPQKDAEKLREIAGGYDYVRFRFQKRRPMAKESCRRVLLDFKLPSIRSRVFSRLNRVYFLQLFLCPLLPLISLAWSPFHKYFLRRWTLSCWKWLSPECTYVMLD